MRLPLKVHAVKIRYREQLLRTMPHGRFGMYRGKRCVYISYIPGNSEVSMLNRKRYMVDSKQGREYTLQIERYLSIKAEYDRLLLDWRLLYTVEPPAIRFPIVQTYDPHHMDNRFFDDAIDKTNTIQAEHPVYSGCDVLKSKNEQFGKSIFKQLGIPYKYEVALDVDNPDGFIPDYLLSFFEIDRCIYAEICGMSDKYEYSRTTAQKINFYSNNNYRPGREIVYSFMYDKYNFDEAYFTELILGAYNALIPEEALDWDHCLPPCITGDSQLSQE